MKNMTVYQQWTTVFIALFMKEHLAELVVSRDTSVWQKDLCQSRNSREPLNVWSITDGFAAGEALLCISVQLLRGCFETSLLEDHVTFMAVERRRGGGACVCMYICMHVCACMSVCACMCIRYNSEVMLHSLYSLECESSAYQVFET